MQKQSRVKQLGQTAESLVVALAARGDGDAFAEIVKRCQNRVRNFMHRLCNNPDLADDLAQQVFLKAWSSIRQLRAPGAFHGWLRRIMVSIWVEELRGRKIKYAEWDESAPAEAPIVATGERIDLDRALAQLPPSIRLCLVLAYNDGLSHEEISDLTHMPLGTVKSNIYRGAERMRALLSDYGKSERRYGNAQ